MGLSRNILKMNKLGQVEPFTFVLSTKNYKHLGKLNNVKTDTIDFKANLNSANEISFEVYKNLNGELESLWDDIIDLKSIYVPELDEYFEINVVYNDKLDELKIITGTSLCEAELSQTIIRSTEINTETDIDRPDYSQTTFYNEVDPKASLLNRVLSFAPHYRIGYVDSSLHNIQRSFSIDGTSIYDFLVGECAEQFNCIFVFDSTKRKINVYDLYTTCYECGHRDAYNFVCPECGSENVNYFGQDTTIFVSKENLSDDIKLETDVGSIKNCFRLRAGDEDMTAAIASINPNGTAYIYYIPPEQRADMSSELINKIDSYDELVEQYTPEYQELAQDIRDLEDEITYYNSTMMPAPVIDGEEVPEDSISKTEIVNLTVENLSPVGIEKLSSATSKSTADTVVKNYARVFVNTSLVKIDVVDSTFEYKEQDSDGWDYGIWTGKLKLTAYSDANDIAITDTLTLTIHDNYGDFLKQKVMKDMALNDKDGSVFDVLNIEELDDFKEALTKYCLSRLNSFRLSLDTAITTLMSLDQASEEADWYASIYVPYHEKLLACADEIIVREATINELEEQLSSLYARKSEIQSILNFENYLGTDLYLEFCTYRREDEYYNENYISGVLSNAEIIDKAKEFLEVAKKELIRSATAQHTISSNLYNIMLMEEFKPLVDKFALGNFIRVQAGDELYRLRLNNYQITFSDLSTINTEFSDMTKSVNVVAATQKILSDAQSMASNFSYISKQAEQGKNANDSLSNIVQEGLDSSLAQIKNNTNEETVIDNNGYLGRALDDVTGKYFPEQLRITHNNIVFTETNWASASCALGKHKYKFYDPESKTFKDDIGYGLSSKFSQNAYSYGTQMIGGDIYSENYSPTDGKGTHINLNDGTFSFAGGNLKYNGSTLSVDGKINAKAGGAIGGWDIGTTYLKTDVLADDGYVRRGFIQRASAKDEELKWIFSVQKGTEPGIDPDYYRGLWYVTNDGDMLVQTIWCKENLSVGTTNYYTGYNFHVDGKSYLKGNIYCQGSSYFTGDNVTVEKTLGVDGTDSGSYSYFRGKLSVGTTTYSTSCNFYVIGDSYFSGNVSAASVTNRSSRRYKENIIPITDEVANRLLDINVCSFDYKDGYGCKNMFGLIAEEVDQIHPIAVTYNGDNEPDAVDYTRFIPLLIKKVQMQQEEINELKKCIN